jgi:SAM-dependent methyltransferase
MSISLGLVRLLAEEVLPSVNHDSMVSLARQQLVVNVPNFVNYMAQIGHPATPDEVAYTSKNLFTDLGFKRYEDIDFNDDEGVTIVHDMNLPIGNTQGQFDFVFECGTMEHIFDIRQVFENVINLCKVGGTVFHCSPLTWINHGFYNFSMTLFFDVYRNNGFEDFKFWIVKFPKNWSQGGETVVYDADFTPTQFLNNCPEDFLLIAFTAKKKEEKLFTVPCQAAYDPVLAIDSSLKQHRRPQ